MIHDLIHQRIIENRKQIDAWFAAKRQGVTVPVYCSFDIRDSRVKIVPVDANIYPAGFNNICSIDRESAIGIMQQYLDKHYGAEVKTVLLLTEEHTNNAYYWDNVAALEEVIQKAGKNVVVGFPGDFAEPLHLRSASGKQLTVYAVTRKGDRVFVNQQEPDLVISNNDFSYSYEDWGTGLVTPMNPPRELGWYQRKKSNFFSIYNELAADFAGLLGVDAWTFQVETLLYDKFDPTDLDSVQTLANIVDKVVETTQKKYKALGIEQEPFVFIKNNSGTYGLGVVEANSGQDVLNWNYKTRKKMKAAKGGGGFGEVIVQEGIPSEVTFESEVAEPAIYMIGCQLAGGFLRVHGQKSARQSLNSPGAVYRRLCVSDLAIDVQGHPMENVYGWVAKLGALAIGLESKKMGVEFTGLIKSDKEYCR